MISIRLRPRRLHHRHRHYCRRARARAPEPRSKDARPPVTPRRFNRFWTSRSSPVVPRPELSDVTSRSLNGQSLGFDDISSSRAGKRRRISNDDFDLSSTVLPDSSPLKPLSAAESIGSPTRQSFPDRIRRANRPRVVFDYRHDTAAFCSGPKDLHHTVPNRLPFSVQACNTNSLVAVGDEKGSVTLIDTAREEDSNFDNVHLTFRPHLNAIMDMAFSSDDMQLATASGDQTVRMIDMRTQTVTRTLKAHMSSLKQVAFQPENDNVIATCNREDIIAIFDLRCKPAEALVASSARHEPGVTILAGGHAEVQAPSSRRAPASPSFLSPPPSITSLTFLTAPGRSHLFVTTSDKSSSIRLWDLRMTSRGSRAAIPLVITTPALQPSSSTFANRRDRNPQRGMNSVVFGSDGSRMYSLCRDNVVYVYATANLLLGQAADPATKPLRRSTLPEVAPGPLYGLTHPRMRTATFFPRLALRKSGPIHREVLATGQSDGTPCLFSTDEWSLNHRTRITGQAEDEVPIYNTGCALIQGHSAEVSGLAWSYDGDLVSISDDYTVRRWHEDAGRATDLRTGGETGGRRHLCGWAELDDDWDIEDG
ncbi:hypothetical protein MRB53_041769 [Persea americana]|nr:hypothetical protein MRB53_041769 [Persea americana]